jgi:predicted CXXCH cytochrome family protein
MARFKTHLTLKLLLFFSLLAVQVSAKDSILNSPHNLSISGGKGAHRIAYDEIRVCVFCHTPHNAVDTNSIVPLWNRALAEGQPYTMYESSSFNQQVNPRPSAPTGVSRICLSCHDGTLALNRYGGPVLKANQGSSAEIAMPTGLGGVKNSNLQTDLSDDHPISFPYTGDLAARAHLVPPEALNPAVRLDKNGNLQCTACHDPHDNEFGNFLVMNNGDPSKPQYNPAVTSPLCVACHAPPGWDNSSPHYAGAGCLNCHATHSAPVKQYLLNAPIDQVCFNGTSCHGTGTPTNHSANQVVSSVSLQGAAVSGKPIASSATQAGPPARGWAVNNLESLLGQSLYTHPVGQSSEPYRVREQLPLRQRRVECVDCHNGHAAGGGQMAGSLKKSLKKVSGVSKETLGSVEAASEYEICYKCHSGSFAFKFTGVRIPNRVILEQDQMKRFDPNNPSFHPVAADRRTGNGNSLLAQYQNTMIRIACSDCHNSDQSKKAGGTGPNGPHGSRYEHILLAKYDMPENRTLGRTSGCSDYRSTYALCFTCHYEGYVMTTGTAFASGAVNEHARHVVDRCIPCFVCHDPHGVSVQDGATPQNNAHLINFDKGYTASQSVPVPRYETNAPASGRCTVSCHAGGTHSYAR